MIFSNFDIRMTLDVQQVEAPSAVSTITIFDLMAIDELKLVDDGSTDSGFYPYAESAYDRDFRYRARAKRLVLLNSSLGSAFTYAQMNTSSYYDSPKYARLELWSGDWFLFELVNTDLPPSESGGLVSSGRLIEAHAVDNSGFTVQYKSWQAQDLEDSPSRLWQIDTVTDNSGPQLALPTIHSNRRELGQ